MLRLWASIFCDFLQCILKRWWLLPAQAMDMAESSDEEGAARDAKRVVVAWWKDDISGLLASLAAFAPRGSHISIVCQEQPEVRATPGACDCPPSARACFQT